MSFCINKYFLHHNKTGGTFMIENIEFLQDIYQFSEMGYYSTNKMLNNIKPCKSKLKQVLYQEKKKYKEYKEKCEDLLDIYDTEVEKVNFFTKLGSGLEINMKVSCEDLSFVPKILIKEINDNILKINKKKKETKEKLDEKVSLVIENFVSFLKQEKEILKEYM